MPFSASSSEFVVLGVLPIASRDWSSELVVGKELQGELLMLASLACNCIETAVLFSLINEILLAMTIAMTA